MPLELTAYGYNPKTGRYVDLKTGRFVKTDDVRQLLNDTIDSGFERVTKFAQAVGAGRADIGALQDAMLSHLHDSHVAMYMLGRGGVNQMDENDFGVLSKRLEAEYKYLDGFMADIQAGRLSQNQIADRMGRYNEHVWASYHDGETNGAIAAGYTEERRIDEGDEDVCDDCSRYAGMGWQPIGTLPAPGDKSKCQTKCRCKKVYRGVDGRGRVRLTQ